MCNSARYETGRAASRGSRSSLSCQPEGSQCTRPHHTDLSPRARRRGDRVKRREFIMLFGGTVAWPMTARGQQGARRPLMVYLAGVSSASVLRSTTRRGFLNGLRDHGFVDGQNLDIVYRFADGQFDRLPALAEEAVSLKPNIILAPAQAGALAARAATIMIPIVCPLLDNPERQGLAVS